LSDKIFAVIGLGKAGLPLSAVIARNDNEVVGVDIDSERCDLINNGINPLPEEPGLEDLITEFGGKNLQATTDYEYTRKCNIFIIIVPLFLDEYNVPDFRNLEITCKKIGGILKKDDIVVLETTVPPKTTETIIRNLLETESNLKLGEFYLAYSPERLMTGYGISRLKDFPKVIGGVNIESGRKAFDVYKGFIANLNLVSSSRVAEFTKVMEGCYRDVNISLANELYKVSEEMKIDFYEARSQANHDYCNLLLPSTGVGGHCIPVYPWFLIHEMIKRNKYEYVDLIRKSREINDEMISYWSKRIIISSLDLNIPLTKIKICIKGITYREGVKEIHNSRNIELARTLQKNGLDTYVYDDLISKDEATKIGLKWLPPKEANIIFDSFNLKISK
jgi:UDP-N-acetyl-D-mannosaminuronic acid dehydrogenase